MSSPRTLPALRAAVARVLVARGESADALSVACTRYSSGAEATIYSHAGGIGSEVLYAISSSYAQAIASLWSQYAQAIRDEHAYATRSAAACQSQATRDRAWARHRKAAAALAVAREIGGES